jgi:hypothetical protein
MATDIVQRETEVLANTVLEEEQLPAPIERATISSAHWTPDWRWGRARYICDNGLSLSKVVDDDLIAICRSFIRARKSGSPRTLETLRRKYPNLYLATEIHEEPRDPLRWILEGAILTEANAEEISSFLCLPEEVVAMYENIYFNVRPFMSGAGLIYAKVLVPSFRRAMIDKDLDLVLKSIAYACDWDVFMKFCSRKPLGKREADILDNMVISELKRVAYKAALQIEINNYNVNEVIEQYLNIRRIDIASSMMPFSSTTDHERIVKDTLGAQPFRRLKTPEDPSSESVFEPRALDIMKESAEKVEAKSEKKDGAKATK